MHTPELVVDSLFAQPQAVEVHNTIASSVYDVNGARNGLVFGYGLVEH